MNKALNGRAIASVFLSVCFLCSSQVRADPIICQGGVTSAVEQGGRVTWGGDTTDKKPIQDAIPPCSAIRPGLLSFRWTQGEFDPVTGLATQHPCYEAYSEINNGSMTQAQAVRQFYQPKDPTITDWRQVIQNQNGQNVTYGGNIIHVSPWSFHPLSELPDIGFRIPDLAPFHGSPDLTIYSAVNLDLYLSSNPNGFLGGNWQVGQTLTDLGIHIVGGQIPGVAGIYWSTTDFTFDPDSVTGWIPIGGSSNFLNSDEFQSTFGDIGILASHTANVPEPSIGLLLLAALGAMAVVLRRSV